MPKGGRCVYPMQRQPDGGWKNRGRQLDGCRGWSVGEAVGSDRLTRHFDSPHGFPCEFARLVIADRLLDFLARSSRTGRSHDRLANRLAREQQHARALLARLDAHAVTIGEHRPRRAAQRHHQSEIKEIFIHVATTVAPAALDSFRIARKVLAETPR